MKGEDENNMNWLNFLFVNRPSRRRMGERRIKEKKGSSQGKKDRRKIIGAKNMMRRAWPSIKEGHVFPKRSGGLDMSGSRAPNDPWKIKAT